MTVLFRTVLSIAVALPLSCSSSEAHPPEYSGPGIDSPRSCGEVRKGTVDGSQLVVDGQPANCATNGLSCPLQGAAAFDGVCSGNDVPVGLCQSTTWTVACVPEPDGGVIDAASDSTSGG